MKEKIFENQTSDMTKDFFYILKTIFVLTYGVYDLDFETTGEKDFLVFSEGKAKINISYDSFHQILNDVVLFFEQR